MPSNLPNFEKPSVSPKQRSAVGPVTRRRLWRAWGIYAALCCLASVCQLLFAGPHAAALALGLVAPGAGFMVWALGDISHIALAAGFGLATLALFSASLILWFGTGNVILPPLIWLSAALIAANGDAFGALMSPNGSAQQLGLFVPIMTAATTAALLRWYIGSKQRAAHLVGASEAPRTVLQPTDACDEISLEDLKRLRLLLDRALQPVDQFAGFEWRDQFQTGAIRYQINFVSYAIAIAQHFFMPAMTGYLTAAQEKLLAKLGEEKVWSYWKFENAWGNLRLNKDPVPDQNIMYSGFIAAQMAYSQVGHTKAELHLTHGNKPFRTYDLDQLTALLTHQYRSSKFGLLACEPNWIYPLCNLITATALRAHSTRQSDNTWDEIAPRFRQSLLSEFTQTNGQFVPFRSSLTGLAPPALGGAVMQAFPVFFLNSLFPDLAEQHWDRLRRDLQGSNWQRRFWPIDVGNYGFSRASSYAASAAAAVEMGDGEMATKLLEMLDDECPEQEVGGFPHRPNASLWAHSLEMIARLGQHNGLRHITSGPPLSPQAGPHLEVACYEDVMIASAKRSGHQGLRLVVYPVQPQCETEFGLAGLMPLRRYTTNLAQAQTFVADGKGRAIVQLRLAGRTQIDIDICSDGEK